MHRLLFLNFLKYVCNENEQGRLKSDQNIPKIKWNDVC